MTETESIHDIGVVISAREGHITVKVDKSGGCKSCSMNALCGSGSKAFTLEFDTKDTFAAGDKVQVMIAPGSRILSSLIVFGLPILGLVAGYLIARNWLSEPVSVVLGFGGLVMMFLFIKLLDKRMANRIQYTLGGKCEDLPE